MKVIFYGNSLTEGIPGVGYYRFLRKKLPNHKLVNKGKGGDTVISLYRRMKRRGIKNHDISFIWIGTNDVLANVRKDYPIFKLLAGQIWSKKDEEFEEYFRKIIELLNNKSKKIFTIPPIFIGEDIKNKWNKKLNKKSKIIKQVSKEYEKVEFIDIRKKIYPKLRKDTSKYIMKNTLKVIMDYLRYKDIKRADKKSEKRGLQFTLDGVHLNSKGAKIVADIFYEKIKEVENEL